MWRISFGSGEGGMPDAAERTTSWVKDGRVTAICVTSTGLVLGQQVQDWQPSGQSPLASSPGHDWTQSSRSISSCRPMACPTKRARARMASKRTTPAVGTGRREEAALWRVMDWIIRPRIMPRMYSLRAPRASCLIVSTCRRVRVSYFFFSSAGQFTTRVMGTETCAWVAVFTRNRWPSGVTSKKVPGR